MLHILGLKRRQLSPNIHICSFISGLLQLRFMATTTVNPTVAEIEDGKLAVETFEKILEMPTEKTQESVEKTNDMMRQYVRKKNQFLRQLMKDMANEYRKVIREKAELFTAKKVEEQPPLPEESKVMSVTPVP